MHRSLSSCRRPVFIRPRAAEYLLHRAQTLALKRTLPISDLGVKRLLLGLIAGVAFAGSFYTVSVARVTLPLVRAMPEVVAGPQQPLPPPPPGGYVRRSPDIVGPSTAASPAWAEPFWAGLAAAFGQAFTLSVWFPWRRRPPVLRFGRARLRARAGIITGLMWTGYAPMVLVPVWFAYTVMLYGGNVWASAFGRPLGADPLVPLVPFGLGAGLLVMALTLEPWRGLQLAYRCRWIPAVGVAAVLALGTLLFIAGRAVPGAV